MWLTIAYIHSKLHHFLTFIFSAFARQSDWHRNRRQWKQNCFAQQVLLLYCTLGRRQDFHCGGGWGLKPTRSAKLEGPTTAVRLWAATIAFSPLAREFGGALSTVFPPLPAPNGFRIILSAQNGISCYLLWH